jgi:hypothetical protein
VPRQLRRDVEFVFVKTVDQVFDAALARAGTRESGRRDRSRELESMLQPTT